MQKKLSVIIPIYNGEKYLEQTIKNILKSTYSEIEILLIDDGSSDSSAEICKLFEKKDSRIKYFYKKNGGIVSARNLGLSNATGDYIAFCDQDDIVNYEIYGELIEKCENNNAEIGLAGTAKKIENSESIILFEQFDNRHYVGKSEIWFNFLYPLIYLPFHPPVEMNSAVRYPSIWKGIYKKEFLDKYLICFKRFIDYEDDLIFLIECYLYARSVVTINKTGYYWRINLQSESHRKKYIKNIEKKQNDFLNYFIEKFKKEKIPEENIKWFFRVIKCREYIDIFNNLASPDNPESWKIKRKEINKYVYSKDLEESMKVKKYLTLGRVQLSVMLNVIQLHSAFLDYYTNNFLIFLNDKVLKNEILLKLERWIKNRK